MYKTFTFNELSVLLPYLSKFVEMDPDKSEVMNELLNFISGAIVNDRNNGKMYKFNYNYVGQNSTFFFVFKETHDYDGPEGEKEKSEITDNTIDHTKTNSNENTNYDHTRLGGNSPTILPNNQTAGPAKAGRNAWPEQVRT